MAKLDQIHINKQVLRDAKWSTVCDSPDGYCFVAGKEGLLFFLATMQGVRVLYPVSKEIKTIGNGEEPDLTLGVWVFSAEKK